MREAGLTARTLSGLKWAGFGAGGQALLSLAILAVLARLLPPADFGVLAIALAFVNAAQALGHRNVGAALVQRAELTNRHVATAATLSVSAGAVLAGAGWALAPMAGRFFAEPAVGPVLRVLSLAILLAGLATVPEFLWRRRLRFGALAAAELLAQAFGYGLVAIALAAGGYGVWALAWGTVARHAVFAVTALAAGPRLPRPLFGRREAGELLGAAAGFTSIALFVLIAAQGSRLVVGRLLGAAALGFYVRAFALASLSGHVGRVVARVLFPAMAQRQRRPRRLAAAYLHGVEVLSLLAVPAALVLGLCADEIVALVLGPQWGAAVALLRILAIGTAFLIGAIPNNSVARAMGALKPAAWREAASASLLLGGVAAGSRLGLAGVAAAAAGALIVAWLLKTQLALSLLGLGWRDLLRRHAPALWAGAWAAPALWLAAAAAREAGLPAAAVLAAGTLAASAAVALALGCAPRFARPLSPGWALAHLPFESMGAPGRGLRCVLALLAHPRGR